MNEADQSGAGRLADRGWWLALVLATPLLGLAWETFTLVVADSPFSIAGAATVATIGAVGAVGGELTSAALRRARGTRA